MTYQETLDYLFSQLPMYQRIGDVAYKVDLENTIQLCNLLNNPQENFKSVHVAGTNGKGSTSHMLASIMQDAGYKVGLYTSPHLKDFRERIKINGEMISETDVIRFIDIHKSSFEQINLSFFEWTVGLAFHYFSDNKVDIAIIETGLGGRLDSTNIVLPEVSVITNIGLDHTQFLGNTLPKIAAEKAGIIKHNIPVIIGETQDEIQQVFIDKASEVNTTISFADKQIQESLPTDLKGQYQKKNVKTVLATINVLQGKGWSIDDSNIAKGLLNTEKNTGLLGRWQTLSNNPLVICDTGHNESGIKEIVAQLNALTYNQLHFVFGAVNDKSIDKILDLLPKGAIYYLCQADIPRALAIDDLELIFKQKEMNYIKCGKVQVALNEAKNQANDNDLIFVAGSTFVVAEVV
ncbi:MAG: bifunctional folylpolyglutamate synthase/dihydrofolate synthase [Flavobacteriales bacterium]|nr:bifunctional folylpolyglutamate synthase/dihydrofolate synthase [Flavobacteriales bacterium]MCB9363589.1 bifunctional folylpolyglutamate synthase/dihydrofolate synthase [Flavobacteriales bacterium]